MSTFAEVEAWQHDDEANEVSASMDLGQPPRNGLVKQSVIDTEQCAAHPAQKIYMGVRGDRAVISGNPHTHSQCQAHQKPENRNAEEKARDGWHKDLSLCASAARLMPWTSAKNADMPPLRKGAAVVSPGVANSL